MQKNHQSLLSPTAVGLFFFVIPAYLSNIYLSIYQINVTRIISIFVVGIEGGSPIFLETAILFSYLHMGYILELTLRKIFSYLNPKLIKLENWITKIIL